MNRLFVRTLILFSLAAFAAVANAQSKPYTPAKGTPERKAILDAVRTYRKAPAEVYTPYGFNVLQGWAMVAARDPQ